MNKRNIRKIMREHLTIPQDDNLKYEEIPDPPFWVYQKREEIKRSHKHYQMPRWSIAVITAVAVFIFMLTPPGHAVSSFIYNIDIQWNPNNNKLEIAYSGNIDNESTMKELDERLENTQSFLNVSELKESYPELSVLINDKHSTQNILVSGYGTSVQISSQYNVDNAIIQIAQNIYFTEVGGTFYTELSDNAVPIETTFNNGSIRVVGGYDDGYGYASAFENNCEYSFLCDNLPLETFIEFIEQSYID